MDRRDVIREMNAMAEVIDELYRERNYLQKRGDIIEDARGELKMANHLIALYEKLVENNE